MATYKEEHGTGIIKVTTDPENPVNGQVWYNSTDQALKGFTSNPVGSWSTGGSLNTSRYWASSSGSQNAGLVFGGYNTANIANNELYNGSSWTELADLNQARILGAGAGTSTSSLNFGGSTPSYTGKTESWDGSAWTEVADLNTVRRQLGGAGASNTSALAIGGEQPPQIDTGATESWNGTAWTEVADLNTPRSALDGGPTGTSTAAFAVGGYKYSPPTGGKLLMENWNGSTWTELNDPDAGADAKFGNPSAALLQGGTDVQIWDGTNWSETTGNSNNLTARAGLGTTSAGLVAGGEPPGTTGSSSVEEWVAPTLTTVTFTTT